MAATPASANAPPAEAIVAAWAKNSTHPLVGKALITATGRVLDTTAIASTATTRAPIANALGLIGPDFILLGEVHDNPEHHWLRAGLLEPLMQASAWGPMHHPGVVVEHLDETASPKIAALATSGTRSAEPFFIAVEWAKSGWPDSKLFEPLFAVALGKRLEVIPGNLPASAVRTLARQGLAAIPPDLVQRLKLDRPLPTTLQTALADELKGSHCGMLPDAAIPGMALAQQARDASMALAITKAVDRHGRAVLLAGNGHVRTDRGVPWFIRDAKPDARIIAVMLIEVTEGRNEPTDYVWRAPDGKPAADVIVFTPRTERPDPCEKMRAHMKSAK